LPAADKILSGSSDGCVYYSGRQEEAIAESGERLRGRQHSECMFAGPEGGPFRGEAFFVRCPRQIQRASDGVAGHSPFSAALLDALKSIPWQKANNPPIPAARLYSVTRSYFEAKSADQVLLGQRLTRDQGQFHFFPEGDFTGYSATPPALFACVSLQ
jgi:hypothetical protein